MANAVVGETSPNYFKEILGFLYSKFGDLNYYNLTDIFTNLNPEEDKEKVKKIAAFLVSLEKEGIIELQRVGDSKSKFLNYRLNIEGFEFCQTHSVYLQIDRIATRS